ncbi:MAG: hypothetical protein L0K86_19025, partial [Actinomycetia bacterium]|nr:hypothetical protein [Actinomycetes bacterium]
MAVDGRADRLQPRDDASISSLCAARIVVRLTPIIPASMSSFGGRCTNFSLRWLENGGPNPFGQRRGVELLNQTVVCVYRPSRRVRGLGPVTPGGATRCMTPLVSPHFTLV